MSVCRHQFFYLARIDNFASSAAHNTPCAPALLEQLRELATLTYVHGKRSWQGERWGISKKEVIATFSTFLFITSIFIPSGRFRTLSSHTHPSQELSRHATYRRLSGRGSLEAADLGEEGGEATTTTTIREEMTTSTTSDSVRPAHTTINLSDKEKGGLSDEETGGGVATVDANL